jgi:ribosomal protein S18 acetylase RimI-like enzyme
VIESLRLDLLAPVDWQVLRAARLEALLDSPHAFTSSYDHEFRWTEAEWQRLFDGSTWIIAVDAGKVIGLARSVADSGRSASRHVESVWVAPTYRRLGVCHALLQALAEAGSPAGMTDLLIWVLEDNHDAQRAYEALGFKPTGERQFLPTFGQFERRLSLCIKRPHGLTSPDSRCDEDILGQARRPPHLSGHGVVGLSAEWHPSHLTLI